MDHKKVASGIVPAIGGKGNLVAAAHCATRLRLVLKDDENIDQAALDANTGVKGTFKQDGQFQIIIGPGDVNDVYKYLVEETGVQEVSTDELKQVAASSKKFNPVMALIKLLSEIFVPLIPALVAGGLLMALGNFLRMDGIFSSKALIAMNGWTWLKGPSDAIQLMSAAPFIFLPILVGISAAKRFGANQFLGAAIGMIMTSPNIGDAALNLSWKLPMTGNILGQNYYYQVIPVLVAVWILSILEKFFHKHLPSAFDFTFTPLFSVMITGFVTFAIVGPVMRAVSDGIIDGIVWLYNTAGFIGMGIFGLTYSAIVLTGLHQSFPTIETQLVSDVAKHGIENVSGDFIFIVASMANVAQGAATWAVFTLTKDKKMKSLASSAGVSAWLGITEPALFGVNLKYRFPFFSALIGSGIAAAIAGLFQVKAASMGAASFIGFLSIAPKSIPFYILCELIAVVVAFSITYIIGRTRMSVFEAPAAADAASEAEIATNANTGGAASFSDILDEKVVAPVDGESVDLSTVNDQVFSAKIMGDGTAIKPSAGTTTTIYAPVDGEITVAYETKHAYGLKSDNGTEVLIHFGIDTVQLDGKGFTSNVKQGDHVKKGDVLGTADLNVIKDAGFDPTVMIIITNTATLAEVNRVADGAVKHGDLVITTKA